MDRRGSGASGDTAPYTIEREFEDVAAVVDVVTARSGGRVALWGHSYGCNPAMGGRRPHRQRPPSRPLRAQRRPAVFAGAIEAIEAAVAAGDTERAIHAAFVDTGVMAEEDLQAFRARPRWSKVVAPAPTLPRECPVEDGWVYRPGQFRTISAPTLMLTGSGTDPALAECTPKAAAAIPNAEIRVLDGRGHFAHRTEPAMVAAVIRGFITG